MCASGLAADDQCECAIKCTTFFAQVPAPLLHFFFVNHVDCRANNDPTLECRRAVAGELRARPATSL